MLTITVRNHTSRPSIEEETETKRRVASKILKAMMDVRLLRDLVFLLFASSNFLTSVGFIIPYVYVKVRSFNSTL